MKKFLHFLPALLLLLALDASGQGQPVQGTVSGAQETLIGATLIEQGTNNATSTDVNGKFRLILKKSPTVLKVSYLGYLDKLVKVTNGANINITLSADVKGLNEVVIVGYGQQKALTNVGAVSQISGSTISQVPNSNVQNTLAGRLPGFSSQQRSGQPGRDGANFFVRGVNALNSSATNPLIIVDDVEWTYDQFSQIDANEIESVSILKDGLTSSIYGVKGANGVVVVKTKRGKPGKAQFNLSTEYGINQIIRMPQFLDSYTTATLRNEALANDGLAPDFTQNDLDLFKSGADPYGHPNTNWVNDMFNRSAPQSNSNLDISGGTDIVKYFINLGAFAQQGQMKNLDPSNQVDPSYYYNRKTFRSNLDITPNQRLKISVDFRGALSALNEPNGVNISVNGVNVRDVWDSMYEYGQTNPFMPDGRNPNGSWASNKFQQSASVSEAIAESGYWKTNTTDLNVNLNVSHQLDFITPGLSAGFLTAYGSSSADNRGLTRGTLPAYSFDPSTGIYTNTDNVTQTPAYSVANQNVKLIRTLKLTGTLKYQRSFGFHNFDGTILYNQTSSADRWLLPVNYIGFSSRFDYNYKNKYLLQVSVNRYGTDKYQGNKRYQIFPGFGLGYNLAEESFFQKALPSIQVFKLRGNWAVTGSDQGPAGGTTSQVYSGGTAYNFGNTSNNANTTVEGALLNTNINWEQERQWDIGMDATIFKTLKITADYFHRYRFDQVITPTNVSSMFGQTLGSYNLGRTENWGYEIQLGYTGRAGKITYGITPNLSYVQSKVLYSGTVAAFPYLAPEGYPIGMAQGYIADGFLTQADIDAINAGTEAKPAVPVKPGYLKYRDLNGDNVIDSRDQALIGKPNQPALVGGLDLTLAYKNFSFDALFQGAADYDFRIFSQGQDPFHSNLQPIVLTRWTPATAATAQYPLLSTKADNYNYPWQNNSTFWMNEARYLRFKQLVVNYSLPTKLVQRVKLRSVNFSVSAYNIATWTNLTKFQQDAEVSASTTTTVTANTTSERSQTAYPNVRQFLFGVRVGF